MKTKGAMDIVMETLKTEDQGEEVKETKGKGRSFGAKSTESKQCEDKGCKDCKECCDCVAHRESWPEFLSYKLAEILHDPRLEQDQFRELIDLHIKTIKAIVKI